MGDFKKGLQQRWRVLAPVVGVVVLVVAYMIYQQYFFVSTDNAQVQAPTVMLAPKVSGYLVKVTAKENQKVAAGETLAEIDPRDYENRVKEAEGEEQSLQAKLKDATVNYERAKKLYNSGATTQQQFDTSTAVYRELTAKLGVTEAKLSQARLDLENTKVKAPSTGVIAKKSAEVGQLAAMGNPLFGFVSSEERWITANFKETEIKDVHLGALVDVTVDAVPGRKFRGKVESMSGATGSTFTLLPPDNATGNFTKVVQRVPVRIQLENLSEEDVNRLQAGLSALVSVHIR
jgi:membrane fusion protein, multidrug efflux system